MIALTKTRGASPELVEDVCLWSKLLKRPRLSPEDANRQHLYMCQQEPRRSSEHMDNNAAGRND